MMLEDLKEEIDNASLQVAFPAEIREEEREEAGTLDAPDGDADIRLPEPGVTVSPTIPASGNNLDDAEEKEQELLDSLRLDGFPKGEAERRKAWMALPRSTRLAIRRLHHTFGSHKPKSVMLRLLRAARVGPEMLKGAMLYRCEQCAELAKPVSVAPAAMPGPYEFNHEVLIDVFEEKDSAGQQH